MSISEKIEKWYKNRIESIKKMKNSIEKDYAIGALIVDLGNNSIRAVCKYVGICYRKAKKCRDFFVNKGRQLSLEFRGRKKITQKYPNLKNDIEKIIENYKYADSHFKSKLTYISINPNSIIQELVTKYNYPKKVSCYNTMVTILLEMNYKYKKIEKTEVIDKIEKTDEIFDNVNEHLEEIDTSDTSVAVASIDDKATKKIGKITDNGKSWINEKALDHDTIFKYSVKPFGILDLKTNETFVTCTTGSSTAEFKVNCIEKYIVYKKQQYSNLKKMVIFLDNGPENSGKRRLWLKKLVEVSKKYNIVINLVYYPPYHSKYNKIERYWARLQIAWNKIVIDTLELLISTINKVTWNNVYSKASLSTQKYEKGIKVSDYEMETKVNKHIIREEGLEKWSIVITPWSL